MKDSVIMGKFPWLFLALWGFLGVGVIYTFDGVVDYWVRVESTEIREESNRFLYNVSHKEWNEDDRPSKWWVLLIPTPWIVSGFLFSLFHVFLRRASHKVSGVVGMSLIGISLILSSWICSYPFNVVYVGTAFLFLMFIVARSFLGKELLLLGFGNTFGIIIGFLGVLAAIYLGYLFGKFKIFHEDIGARLLIRGNAIQLTLISFWWIGLGYGLLLRPLLKLRKSQAS